MSNKKFAFDNIGIELTRRCNENCIHCKRGKSEDIEISVPVIRSLFSKTRLINRLIIGGGEPTLAIKRFSEMLEVARQEKCTVKGLYLSLNGHRLSDLLMDTLFKWSDYIGSKPVISISSESWKDYNIELNALKFLSNYSEYFNIQVVPEFEDITNDEMPENLIKYPYLNCKGNIVSMNNYTYKKQDENIICNIKDLSLKTLLNFGGK